MIPFLVEELSWGRISCSLRRCLIFFRSKILMGIIQVHINDEEIMKMELGFPQWCPVTGLEAVDTKGKQEIPFNMSKYFFYCESDWEFSLRGLGVSVLGDIQASLCKVLGNLVQLSLLWAGVWTRWSPNVPSSLTPSVILQSVTRISWKCLFHLAGLASFEISCTQSWTENTNWTNYSAFYREISVFWHCDQYKMSGGRCLHFVLCTSVRPVPDLQG